MGSTSIRAWHLPDLPPSAIAGDGAAAGDQHCFARRDSGLLHGFQNRVDRLDERCFLKADVIGQGDNFPRSATQGMAFTYSAKPPPFGVIRRSIPWSCTACTGRRGGVRNRNICRRECDENSSRDRQAPLATPRPTQRQCRLPRGPKICGGANIGVKIFLMSVPQMPQAAL